MSDNDELPIFRPRMGGRSAGGRKTPSLRNALLAGMKGGLGLDGSATRLPRSRTVIRAPGLLSRRVVVKARVVRMSAYGKAAAALHLRYIQREGVERDGSPGRLYGARGVASAEAFQTAAPGERHQFRMIISPEDGAELDLTSYIRIYMARLEKDLGRSLEWAAVNHYNTDNPHAHVVVRGLDRDGRELRLDRAYVSHGLRALAQEVATEELGPRRAVDLDRQRSREVTQTRWTGLDRELERRASGLRIDLSVNRPGSGRQQQHQAYLVGRLQHLERLRVAERTAPMAWAMAPGWKEALREMGDRGDILKAMHRALRGDPGRYHILTPEKPPPDGPGGGIIYGRVASKGLADELRGRMYAVIETPTGRGYYAPLDLRSAEDVREGDLVSLKWVVRRHVRPIDRDLWMSAQQNAGVASPEALGRPWTDAERSRLQQLERQQLATPLGRERWRLDDRMLDVQEAKDRAPARMRLIVQRERLSLDQQIRHAGPTALDRIPDEGLAKYGLGAEVRRARVARAEHLRGLGVDLSEPIPSLRILERRALGERIARESGQSFLSAPPPGFRGRVSIQERLPDGLQYAEVSDGRRFALVRASPALRAREGREITLAADRERRPDGRGRGGG